jgi:hypothetical protein
MATDLLLTFRGPGADAPPLAELESELRGASWVAAARAFTVDVLLGERPPAGFPELVICELDGALGPAAGDLQFHATTVGPRSDFDLPAHLYLQFSAPPPAMSFEDYSDWYQIHQDENIAQTDTLARGWRFRLEALDSGAVPRPRHLAVYEIEGSIEQVTGDLGRAMAAGVISLPDWFDRFASLEARAADGGAPALAGPPSGS